MPGPQPIKVSLRNRRANRLCVTNVTGLLPACLLWCSSNITVDLLQKDLLVWRKLFSNRIVVTLVTQGLPSFSLSRPFA